jgi:CheY-like chemotaxis protein
VPRTAPQAPDTPIIVYSADAYERHHREAFEAGGATRYVNKPDRANTEAFDAVIDYGDALIAVEEKGKYLEFSAKYSGQRECCWMTSMRGSVKAYASWPPT